MQALNVATTPNFRLYHKGKEVGDRPEVTDSTACGQLSASIPHQVVHYRAEVMHIDLLRPFLMKMYQKYLQPSDDSDGTGAAEGRSRAPERDGACVPQVPAVGEDKEHASAACTKAEQASSSTL